MNGSKSRELRKLTPFPDRAERKMFHGATGGHITEPARQLYQHAKRLGKGIPVPMAMARARASVGESVKIAGVVKRRHTSARDTNQATLSKRRDAQRKRKDADAALLRKATPQTKRPWMTRAKSFIGAMFQRKQGRNS